MLAAHADEAMRLRGEAHRLAQRLNGGNLGILAGPGAAGCVLERETAAPPGAVPLWGQTGTFVIEHENIQARIALEEIFGTASSFCYWPGFAAEAVDRHKPFISETGYRSFLGIHADPQPGLTPDEFACKVVAGYFAAALKGRPVATAPRYRVGDGA